MKKIIQTILIFYVFNAISTKGNLIEEVFCDLSIRPYPFVYFGQTKNMEFRVLFLSSCLDFPLLYYFTLPYNHEYNLYGHTHPTFVRLTMFGRIYDLKYEDAYER